MNKEQTLESLELAKRYHIFQMDKVEALIKGKDMGELPSVYKTGCNFGKWLYDDENRLKPLLGSIFYKELDSIHSQWHLEYRQLYLIFFTEPDKDGISEKKKVKSIDIDKAKFYYSEMQTTSSKLIKSLSSCKRRLEALGADRFQ